MRRIGVLMNLEPDDPESQARLAAFRQALQELGWVDGRNILMEYRWGAADVARARKLAAELIALAPDVILASASPTVAGLQEVTRTVPIVFANVIDAVGAGFVESMARPGGNTTGFTAFEYSISGKWLEMLKQIAPRVTRVAVLRDAAISSGIGQFAVIQAVAPSFGVELSKASRLVAETIASGQKNYNCSTSFFLASSAGTISAQLNGNFPTSKTG
jgi:putative ABC transport system substrate-binding protein